jgi:transcription regulator MmyB-like protein
VRAVVGTLRVAAGRNPDDVTVSTLIGEPTVRSTEFSEMWAAHRVKTGGDAFGHHPPEPSRRSVPQPR